MAYRLSKEKLLELGKNIRKERRRQRKSQLEIAVDAGIEPGYYSLIERGNARNPSLAKVYAILRALGVTSSHILPF